MLIAKCLSSGYTSITTDYDRVGIEVRIMSEARESPQLETDRLILRELTLSDAAVYFPHFANKEVVRYEDSKPAPNIRDVTEITNWGANPD